MNIIFTIDDKEYELGYNQIVYKCEMRLVYRICLLNINYKLRLKYIKLGRIFLKSHYLVLNYENNTVGLVESNKGNLLFNQDNQYRNKMIKVITIWSIVFLIFCFNNTKDILDYNRVTNKLLVFLYARIVQGKEE